MIAIAGAWGGVIATLQAAADPLPGATTGFGLQVLRSLVALGLVCVVAMLTLRWVARRSLLQFAAGQRVRVLERVALDSRRSVYLVQAGKRVFLLGASEQAVNLVAELTPEELAAMEPAVALPKRVGVIELLTRAGRETQKEADAANAKPRETTG